MAQQDFSKLASQGRAFDASRAWTEEELESLIALEKGAEISRLEAAECVRNGIATVEMYNKAMEIGLEVKSLESVKEEAIVAHKEDVRAQLGLETEVVAEVVEEAVVVETTAVEPKTEVVAETSSKGKASNKK